MDQLGMMYQNGMGSLASMMGGQQMAADRQMAAQKLRELTMQNDQSAVMNPLNAQFKQGQIAQQGAELPGIVGQSQVNAAAGNEAVDTYAQKIATKLSAYSTSIGNDGMVKMGQDGEKLSHAAQIIKNYPPALQKQMFQKAIQQYGGDPNSPMFQGLMQAPDEQFQKAAESLGNGMALAGQKYKQEFVAEGAKQASHEKIATGNNTTAIEVAKIQAKAKVDAADSRSKAAMSHMKMDDKITYLTGIPEEDRTPSEQAQLIALSQQRISERTAPAAAVAPTVLGQKTPQQQGLDTATSIHGKGKQATSVAPAIPAGYKQVGTSKGIPVLEGPDGKRFLWGK